MFQISAAQIRILSLSLCLGMSQSSWAETNIGTSIGTNIGAKIGEVAFGGTGCKAETLAQKDTEHGIQLSLASMKLVAKYDVSKLARKACAISIPIEVDAHSRVIGVIATYSGAVLVQEDAQLKFSVEHFLPGEKNRVLRASFDQTEATGISMRTPLLNLQTECGKNINLRANFSFLAQARHSGDLAAAELTEVDYRVITESCE